MADKPKLSVHKFSSCDGCQLALLNLGETLLELPKYVDIVHFAEAGPVNENEKVDVALVEGSVNTEHDLKRIQTIRENTGYLISIGACATSGGLQSLRNFHNAKDWAASIYAHPEYLDSLATATPIADHVKVDLEIWGCPVNSKQVVSVLRDLLSGVRPHQDTRSLCMECKRQGNVCTLVTSGQPCMGPVTKAGCGALCPSKGRACYACYGPAEQANAESLGERLIGIGFMPKQVSKRYRMVNSSSDPFKQAGDYFAEREGPS